MHDEQIAQSIEERILGAKLLFLECGCVYVCWCQFPEKNWVYVGDRRVECPSVHLDNSRDPLVAHYVGWTWVDRETGKCIPREEFNDAFSSRTDGEVLNYYGCHETVK